MSNPTSCLLLQGALALTSASKLTSNRGTGVRAVGAGSWAVQSDCVITLNSWHGKDERPI